jgi:hypothetical protein
VEISPEVLTNSQLFVSFDISNEREALANISLMKDWRFLPRNPLFLTPIGLTVKNLKSAQSNLLHFTILSTQDERAQRALYQLAASLLAEISSS